MLSVKLKGYEFNKLKSGYRIKGYFVIYSLERCSLSCTFVLFYFVLCNFTCVTITVLLIVVRKVKNTRVWDVNALVQSRMII